jgi:hypothetical protein
MNRILFAITPLVLAAALSLPSPAHACGGFFCSALQLIPVQQNAERILFTVNDDGTITALIEIRYTGSPEDFSWVVPVPGAEGFSIGDTLAIGDPQTLALLDDATAPSIIPPPVQCTGGGGGIANRGGGLAAASSMEADASFGDDDDSVIVEDEGSIGDYDYQVISSDNADALVDWLNENDYLITPEMVPFIADYVAAGMRFVGTKLQAGADTSQLAPLEITYPGTEPMIPIRLTAVGAEPEMGVVAFIAADSRYEGDSWESLPIAAEDVMVDPRNGASNYYSLLSWRIDQAGGRAMVPQFSGDSNDVFTTADNSWSWDQATYGAALEDLAAVADEHATITRLYTRASAWEMADGTDPTFTESDGGTLSNIIDLSGRDPVEICATAPNEQFGAPCGEMYCGQDALCATTKDGPDGCVCPDGYSARLITAPRALSRTTAPTVVCEQIAFELIASAAEMTGVAAADPCADSICGDNGTCLAINGFGTCRCDDGYAAVDAGGAITCLESKKTYGPEQLLWTAGACGGCSEGGDGSASWWTLLLLPLALRRRQRQD